MAWVGSRNAARHPPWPAARRWSKVEGLQKVVKFDFISYFFGRILPAHRSHAHTPTASSQRRLRKCSVMSSTLDDMTYRQLQALAKQHKIAANQKKVVLIEKLGAVMTAKAQPATATTAKAQPATATTAKAQPAAATAAQKENSGPDNAVTDEVWKWVKDEASAIKAAKDGAMRALEVSERLASAESKIINFSDWDMDALVAKPDSKATGPANTHIRFVYGGANQDEIVGHKVVVRSEPAPVESAQESDAEEEDLNPTIERMELPERMAERSLSDVLSRKGMLPKGTIVPGKKSKGYVKFSS